ncbi:MAG: PLDc_N domain-containing protein [Elusimicrobia bacterium]|nr:PLDc_N domain-containing protein [Elusimicrobiota bacterium]
MNWLLFVAMMVYSCLGLLFVVIPIIALVHCARAKHISPGKKILWVAAMVVFWGFGPLLYLSISSRNNKLEYLSVFGSALLLGFLSLFLLPAGSGNMATTLKRFKAIRSLSHSKGAPLSPFGSVTVTEETIGKSKIMRMDAPGNLESLNDLGCVELTKITNKITPADLYKSLAKCIEEGSYKKAAQISAIAGVYGRYDTLRVADPSAHQAVGMLKLVNLGKIGQEKEKFFFDAIKEMAQTSRNIKEVCGEIRKIGPPNYFPHYMVQHGAQLVYATLSGTALNEPLVKDFDSKAAWEKSLDSYLHCASVEEK